MKNLYIIIFSILLVFLLKIDSYAQCNQQVPLMVVNPSFEGPRRPHITPSPWSTCGVTPDTQPGSWGVNTPPSNGSSYVGFVNGGSSWLEGASQALSGSMIANVTYTFTIDLATTSASGGGINPSAHCGINLYGAHSICATTELLWSSPIITHYNWHTYTVTFTPTQNYSHIYFRIYGGYLGYVLVDNITPFIAQGVNITSHVNGQSENCSFNLAGTVTGNNTDSVVITGNFVETPLTANLTGNNWTAHLTFNAPGTETVTATSYYTIGGVQYCVFTTVDLILAPPTATFTAPAVCDNDVATFTDGSYSAGQESVTSWSWNFGDGSTSTQQNPTHLFPSAGTYNVQLNVTTNNNCTGSTTVPFVVNPLPISNAGQDSLLNCSRTSMNLNGSGSDMGANFSHLWTTPDGNIVSGNTTVSPLIDHTGTYTITTTNTSTSCFSSDDVVIGIDTITPYSDAGLDTVITCIPQVNLDGSLSSQGNYSYLWTTNIGNIIGGNTTLTPTVGAVATYYLEVTSLDNGCTDFDSVDVGIDTLKPIANAGMDTLITCGHMNIDLNGSLSDTGSLFSYNWGAVGGNIVSNNTTLYPNVDADGIYYITVLNSRNNCTSTDSVNVGIDTIHPVAYAGMDSIVTCNIPVIALNGAGSSTGNYSYQWTTNDGNIIANDTTLTPSIDTGGVYTLTVINNYNGCSSSDNVNILADLTAVVDILYNSISTDSIFGVAPEDVDYSWIGDYGTVTWDLGDNNSSTDSSLTHTYNLRGDYWAMITLVDSSGCIAYDSVYVLIDGREIVFPNIFTPNGDGENDIFTFRAERIKEFECSIYNRWGQKLFSWDAPVGGWDGRTYAGKESPSGEYLYILHAVDRNGKSIEKKGFVMLMR